MYCNERQICYVFGSTEDLTLSLHFCCSRRTFFPLWDTNEKLNLHNVIREPKLIARGNENRRRIATQGYPWGDGFSNVTRSPRCKRLGHCNVTIFAIWNIPIYLCYMNLSPDSITHFQAQYWPILCVSFIHTLILPRSRRYRVSTPHIHPPSSLWSCF